MAKIATFALSLALAGLAAASGTALAQDTGGQPAPEPDRAPVAVLVSAGPQVFRYGGSTLIRYRVDDDSPRVEVRLYIRRVAYPRQRVVIRLGRRTTNRDHSYNWRNAGELAGLTEIKVWARDPGGKRIAHSSENPGAIRVRYLSHVFPVGGAFDLGGEGAVFGAPRNGHTHQGQDLTAAEGTPLLAVRSGVIRWRRFQAGGAGHYLVLDADGEDRDYVYMHIKEGSILVKEGDRVTSGQELAGVGSTGASSGPHLHFEIWQGPWYDGGAAIDPLPHLRRWLRLAE